LYTGRRSTGQTAKPAAHRQVQKWLAEGLPDARKKDLKATRNRLIAAIAKYLVDCDIRVVRKLQFLNKFLIKNAVL
jgi:hypothetical protein